MRNIRILNDINKFTKTPAADEPENSGWVKALNLLFGKASTHDPELAEYFYSKDTEARIQELKSSIKKAARNKQEDTVKRLEKELEEFVKSRE